MSILNNVLKVCGTVIEGCGKTICDCVDVVVEERKEYKASEEYQRDKAERDELKREIKEDWAKICENLKKLR